jgi:hypothetical protein
MRPVILLWAALLFIIVFACHVIVWRIFKPKAQIACLLALFVLLPLIGFVVLLLVSIERLDCTFTFVLYFALAGVYIQTYPAIYANAPSLFIVHLIGQSKSGLSLGALQEALSKTGITSLDARMKDLVNDSLIAVSPNESVSLTPAGRILAVFMITFRQKILGLKEGEG